MSAFLQIAMYLALSSLLVFAAVSDVRSRRIPLPVGLGLLCSSLVLILRQGHFIEAGFLVLAVIGSRGGWWSLLVWVAAIVMTANLGQEGSLPMVVGLMAFYVLFKLRWIGGGDAQVGYALVAFARDWTILYYLAGILVPVGLFLVFRRYGFLKAFSRLWTVTRSLFKASPADPEAIRTPWALWAAIGGLAYIFIFPGPALHLARTVLHLG